MHLEFHHVPYVVLELIEGVSLEREIAARIASPDRCHFTPQELASIFEPVLEALAFAHESGVAHRDIKPSNIILVPSARGGGTAKIVDFGIARWAGEQAQPTGMTGFTPAYAAPEQWDDSLGPSGPASDVYSLALVIEEACKLAPIPGGATPARIFAEIMGPKPRIDLRTTRPDLPEALERALIRATMLDLRERHGNAGELLADFRDALREHSPEGGVAPSRQSMPLRAHTPLGAQDPWTQAGPELESALVNPTASPMSAPALRAPRSRAGLLMGVSIVATMAVAAVVLRLTMAGAPTAAAPVTPGTAPAPASAAAPPDPSEGASVTVTSLAAGSALTSAMADQVAAAHTSDLLPCYREALGRSAALSGEVSLLVTVSPSGKVFATRDMDEGTYDAEALRDKALRFCVDSAVAKWTFPTHTKNDVAGALLTFRFRLGPAPEPPPGAARPESLRGRYGSLWILMATKVAYPVQPLEMEDRGAHVIGDYPDGVMACSRCEDTLHCQWIQTDSTGRATLEKKRGGALKGTWGFTPSDSNAGSWELKPAKH
jgi:hypothetical protein